MRKILGAMFFGLLNLMFAWMYGVLVFLPFSWLFETHGLSKYWALIPAIPVACYFAGVLLVETILEE